MSAMAAETAQDVPDETDFPTAAAKYSDACDASDATRTKTRAAWPNSQACWRSFAARSRASPCTSLQAKRPTLWEMEAAPERHSRRPLLIIVGDEDDCCLEPQPVPQAHRADRRPCSVIAALRAIPSPAKSRRSFNAALAELVLRQPSPVAGCRIKPAS